MSPDKNVPPVDEPPTATNLPASSDEPDKTNEEAATDEPEAPEPSPVHVNAAVGFTKEDAEAGAKEYGEFYIGMWGQSPHERPNFGCPYCFYSSIEGSGDVELHILSKIDSGDIVHRAYLPAPEGA